jgi:hypothetical protein
MYVVIFNDIQALINQLKINIMTSHIARLTAKKDFGLGQKPFIDIIKDSEIPVFNKNYAVEILETHPSFDAARSRVTFFEKIRR